MKFYSFKPSLDNFSIGKYPQVDKLIDDYNYLDESSITQNYLFGYSSLNHTPNLNGLLLNGKAKLTDVLSCSYIHSYIGLLFSNRLSNLLKGFSLPKHQVIKATVYAKKKGNSHDYKLFWFYEESIKFLDFDNSTFFLADKFGQKIEELRIIDLSDYHKLTKKLSLNNKTNFTNRKFIKIEKLKLNSRNCNLDIFRVNNNLASFFVSEKLLKMLHNLDITGFDFKGVER